MPETLSLPPKAVPLGKVASPQAMTEGVNSLSQNLTVLPAPSEREPLARPETLHFSQKLSHYAKGPIPEGAVAEGDWGSFGRYPLTLTTVASSPKGTPLRYAGNLIATAKSRPLGEGGCDQREQTEGVTSGQATLYPSQKPTRYAKGSPFGRAVTAGD